MADRLPHRVSRALATSSIERIDVITSLSFTELIDAFESSLGRWEPHVGDALVRDQVSWQEAKISIGAMAGPRGLMIFSKINQGEIASLAGTPRSSVIYLVGNPLIATTILQVDIRAGMLVPFRVELYEDGQGGILSYDAPSSFLGSLDNPALTEIGKALDEKMSGVAAELTSRPGS
ncbi:DUF302 domain-containing protein [Tardiphaga sp. P9-11]|uniref:DUF302 domain-containing protein n=1 Tax=Tardiphaga sp. P9-11 TaxID=2024614 RepID=UPI0011F31E6A|nr:DUF302 domain-containing protein [Tardiphaga sp. P9-11]KAA0070025.1 DUF302 domain-containing protein [Tardiphaga sp. P9-11]